MNEALRPLTVGEILDRTANLYKSRFLVFFGIAAVPATVVLGFGGLMVVLFAWAGTSGPGAQIAVVLGALALTLIGLPLMLGANALSGAALCEAASTLSLGGAVTISSAFKAVWKRGWSYVGLYLLLTLILFGSPMAVWVVLTMGIGVIGAVAGANAGALGGALMLLTFVGLTVYFVWMLVRVCLAFPIAVVERAPVGAALKRAWGLSEGARWRIVVLFLLATVLYWLLSLVLMVPLTMVMAMVPALNAAQHAQTVNTVLVIGFYATSFVVQALTMPVIAIALVLFYFDQRVRREGFDIEMLMRKAGMENEPVAVAEAARWMPEVLHGPPEAGPESAAPEDASYPAAETVPVEAVVQTTNEDANAAVGGEAAPDAMGDGL